MKSRVAVCLLALAFLYLAGKSAATTNLGGADFEIQTVQINPNTQKQQAAALQQAILNNQTLSAVLNGTGLPYALDVGGSGLMTMYQPNATSLTVYVKVKNLSGQMPPFKQYVRISDGIYKYRIVFGLPEYYWSQSQDDPSSLELFITFYETTLFPRVPGWTLQEVFGFLFQAPEEFFFTVHTLQYVKGAISGTLLRT